MGAYTEHDIKIWGECLSHAVDYAHGDENDVMQICYGYGLFTGGLGAHYGSISAGCVTIPISAGNTERQIVSEDGALFWSQIEDVMKTFPEMSS